MKRKKNMLWAALMMAAVGMITSCNTSGEKKMCCHIEGTVADSTYTYMLLTPQGSDVRTVKADTIPVVNGKFSFDLYVNEVLPYEIISMDEHNNGAWWTCEFFAEEGTVNITYHLFKDKKKPDVYSETPTNSEYLRHEAEVGRLFTDALKQESDSLKKIGRWDSPRMTELKALFDRVKDDRVKDSLASLANALYESGEAYTPEYHTFQKKSKQIRTKRDRFVEDYIRNSRSLVGLFLLKQRAHWGSRSYEKALSAKDSLIHALYTEVYRSLFPTHSMSEYMELWVQSQGIRVGGHYVDFTAPDLNGNLHTLSQEIAGKVALIDLWASWCGPCRRASLSMKPVYEAYKDKGFTIVGVAREYEREDMERALVKDGYPWLNLLELQDANRIWAKYGVDRAGGIILLVDTDGTILAINPSAEEVEKVLDERMAGYGKARLPK